MIRDRTQFAAPLAFTAAGLLCGLSFVAAPVKFLADDVPLSDLLAVGRVTFRASAVAESGLFLSLILTAQNRARRLAVATAAILFVQHLAIMPTLDASTLAVMHGEPPKSGWLHWLWIGCDLAKMAMLTGAGLISLRHIHDAQSPVALSAN